MHGFSSTHTDELCESCHRQFLPLSTIWLEPSNVRSWPIVLKNSVHLSERPVLKESTSQIGV
ncbi:hypothetical protein BH160DRAFT_0498 [Burkholderia sp. H160]|nr:hypothetical protein BH160DRAFT_0498 [Burkholderia sp. H160]